MAKYNFSVKASNKEAGKAVGISLPISFKQSIEVCSTIRGKPLLKAYALLDGVKTKSRVIEFRKYNKGGTGHKPGTGPGRYPEKACDQISKILKSAEANASNVGLSTETLHIFSAVAQKAAKAFHYGRHGRRKMKRTHIEIVLKEKKPEKRISARAKQTKTEAKKTPRPKPTEEKKQK